MRHLRRLLLGIIIVFVAPSLATIAWWQFKERPGSWRAADWSASGVLPPVETDSEAAIYLMAARTGGLKGALSVHSWIVTRRAGANSYDRYDKVGWGSPVRRNNYPADGRWYSNTPWIVHAVYGEKAERLIPEIEAAIADYPFSHRGDYRIWPGPNSNTFVAHVLREVPEFGGYLPPNATGRDFAPGIFDIDWSDEAFDMHVTFGGVLGFAAGRVSGLELHFMGLVAGFDFRNPAVKIPAAGTIGLFPAAMAAKAGE
ncbi:MAG: DUF3750 domain-containing protein [Rhizobiaceae bacterium]|nr:DUF3750 domain-containing protein [Rhizobiaceae bacterium]